MFVIVFVTFSHMGIFNYELKTAITTKNRIIFIVLFFNSILLFPNIRLVYVGQFDFVEQMAYSFGQQIEGNKSCFSDHQHIHHKHVVLTHVRVGLARLSLVPAAFILGHPLHGPLEGMQSLRPMVLPGGAIPQPQANILQSSGQMGEAFHVISGETAWQFNLHLVLVTLVSP